MARVLALAAALSLAFAEDSVSDTYTYDPSTGAPTTTPITALCEPDTDYAWEEVAVAGATYSVVTIPAGLGKISLKVSGYAVKDVAVVKANETLPSYTSENATDSACDETRPYWAAFDEHCSACSGEAAAPTTFEARRRLDESYDTYYGQGHCYDPNEYDLYALTGTVYSSAEDCASACVEGADSMNFDLKGVRYDAESNYCACQTVCDCKVGLLDLTSYALIDVDFDFAGLAACYETYEGYGCDGQSYVELNVEADSTVEDYEDCGDACADAITSSYGDSTYLAMAVFDGSNCLCYYDCGCMTQDSSLTSRAWTGTTVDT